MRVRSSRPSTHGLNVELRAHCMGRILSHRNRFVWQFFLREHFTPCSGITRPQAPEVNGAGDQACEMHTVKTTRPPSWQRMRLRDEATDLLCPANIELPPPLSTRKSRKNPPAGLNPVA